MPKLSKRIFLLTFIGVIILLCFIIRIYTLNNYNKLNKNFKITTGIINKVEDLKGSPYLIDYSYKVGDRFYQNRDPLSIDNISKIYIEQVFVGKHLLVVYDSLNNHNSKLLLSERDYNNFNLKPDSITLTIFKRIDKFRIGYDANKY